MKPWTCCRHEIPNIPTTPRSTLVWHSRSCSCTESPFIRRALAMPSMPLSIAHDDTIQGANRSCHKFAKVKWLNVGGVAKLQRLERQRTQPFAKIGRGEWRERTKPQGREMEHLGHSETGDPIQDHVHTCNVHLSGQKFQRDFHLFRGAALRKSTYGFNSVVFIIVGGISGTQCLKELSHSLDHARSTEMDLDTGKDSNFAAFTQRREVALQLL